MAFVVLEIPPNVHTAFMPILLDFMRGQQTGQLLFLGESKSIKRGLKCEKMVHKREDKELFKMSGHSWEMHGTLNAQHPVLDSLSVNKGSFSSL